MFSNKKNEFTVLVIDDNPLELGLIRLVVKKTFPDINFIGLSKPPDWSTFIKENEVDVIIIDYRLPVRSGLEEIRELRKFDDKIDAFLITALEKDEIDQDISKAGVTDVIVKNRNYSNLVTRLNSLIVQKTAKKLQDEIETLYELMEHILDKVLLQIDEEKNCIRVLGNVDQILFLQKEDLLNQNWLSYFKDYVSRDISSEILSKRSIEKLILKNSVKINFEKENEKKVYQGLEILTNNYLFIAISKQ